MRDYELQEGKGGAKGQKRMLVILNKAMEEESHKEEEKQDEFQDLQKEGQDTTSVFLRTKRVTKLDDDMQEEEAEDEESWSEEWWLSPDPVESLGYGGE
ncbi:hypothetical protein NDU88_003973 [Pleurodeles waltl]|uniref:Uncharacterized protein n=1 Tax=Pleurodeles waltl TaxID=8319 RepID=A0AAV7WUA9_PLEWA|nr:hypothetical protein NDU88_003973 [Pleurodeles waltl]